jgi:glutathione S-transferase
MKLYYTPAACSVAAMIAFTEAGIPFEPEPVDFMRGRLLRDGRKLSDVNDRDYVPALVLDDGQLVTEGAAILLYAGDLRPETKLVPPPGTIERLRLHQWLVFIATELHKGFAPLFQKDIGEAFKELTFKKVKARFASLEKGLGDGPFLMGEQFTVADAYAFYALRAWTRILKQELSGPLAAYCERIAARPKVKAALEIEGFGV